MQSSIYNPRNIYTLINYIYDSKAHAILRYCYAKSQNNKAHFIKHITFASIIYKELPLLHLL